MDTVEISLDRAVEIADEAWAKELEEFNRDGPKQVVCEGPFRIPDYRKRISLNVGDGRPVLYVFYQHRKPVTFHGHPQHFGAWVYLDSGEVRLLGGR